MKINYVIKLQNPLLAYNAHWFVCKIKPRVRLWSCNQSCDIQFHKTTIKVLENPLTLQNPILVTKSMINLQNLNKGHKVQIQETKSNLCYKVHIDIAKNPTHVMKSKVKLQNQIFVANPNWHYKLRIQVTKSKVQSQNSM